MSEKARLKRQMRLRGEKRVESEKPTGMADHMIPGIRMDMLADRLRQHDPDLELMHIDDDDLWLGRFEMSEENLEAGGDGLDLMQRLIRPDAVWKEDYTAAGAWLRENDNYGYEKDRIEVESSRSPGTVPGDELARGEVQSRAGDHETLEKEGSTSAETPDDSC